MFKRDDWTMFRNLTTLSQKAGVPTHKLRALIVKELVDNALDASHQQCVFGKEADNSYYVQDFGPGLNMSKPELEAIFSINRPLTSSKVIRRPSRGALGNGLRVVVGCIMSSGGELVVETNGSRYDFEFDIAKGTSKIWNKSKSLIHSGTKITVRLGDSVPKDEDELRWGEIANRMSEFCFMYEGPTNPWWYDSDSFFELLMSSDEDFKLEQMLVNFGFDEELTKKLIAKVNIPTHCFKFTHEDADKLLFTLRMCLKEIKPVKMGTCDFAIKTKGVIEIAPGRGRYHAKLPYVMEAYATLLNNDLKADETDEEDTITLLINGTTITGDLYLRRQVGKLAMYGCGCNHFIGRPPRRKFNMFLSIIIPYMPITTDGKAPNLKALLPDIEKLTRKATAKFKTDLRKLSAGQREIIVREIDDGIRLASGNGEYRYSLRQLFYAIRPSVLSGCDNPELDYNYFARVITELESERGVELPGIYRDPRGTLYHPHLGISIPLGTIAVEEYERPDWTFNKILYCEKEGFFPILRQVGWPERNDCALLSSKGFASRAVRDVLDLLGETDQDIQFFCIHDADASGTLIYQALTQGTAARAARKVKIVNLGLDPWSAVEMGLQIEDFTSKRTAPVANYVKKYDRENDGEWEQWLQGRRIELNAMTSPQFLVWLDKQMAPFSTGKIIPPNDVLRKTLIKQTESQLRERIANDILTKAGINNLVSSELANRVKELDGVDVRDRVQKLLKKSPSKRWDGPLSDLAKEISHV